MIKLFFVLLLNFYHAFYMNFTEFEQLLGKDINIIKKVIDIDFEKVSFKNNESEIEFYSSKEFFYKNFYGETYNQITMRIDKENKLESITLHFPKVIDLELYNSLTQSYGEPNNILIVKNRKKISESSESNKGGKFSTYLSKNEFDLEEGTFGEKPLYIIWKKKNYEIKTFLRHKTGISEITFRLL